MSDSVSFSRRKAIKALAGAPFLPLAASFIGEAEAGGPPAWSNAPASYSFGSMAAPTLENPARMATTYVASTITKKVGKGKNSGKTYALGYETFFLTGEEVPQTGGGTIVAGSYFNSYGLPIMDTSTAPPRQFFSDSPDGMSLIHLEGAHSHKKDNDRIFAVVQFEYTSLTADGTTSMYGKLPSPIAVLALDQDRRTGQLGLVSYYNVDTSAVKGLWITCGASRSPWNTHLASEEYEPDASLANPAFLAEFSQNFFGDDSAKPYDYGHLPEVTVRPDGTGSIKKHYCLGRISHELVQVMPDERTVLMGDDATNGGLFMFVADHVRDLSAGTLYVAKWTQTSGVGPGAGDISWIKLGHATSDEIKAMVAGGIQASDIMDIQTSDPGDATYTKIGFNGKDNWVRLVPGMEKAAAFLETHRYAALVGGSMEFTKMEGTTVNAADKRAYSAISSATKTMTDGKGDIQVQGPGAGAVYEHVLEGGQVALYGGGPIDSEWVSTHMAAIPALIGEDIAPDSLGNVANPNRIANPDNIKYSEAMRTLFIGEDSGTHVNNFLWAYNVDTKELSRIMSCPAAAESTGLQAVDDLNGFSYIMSNFQHAGDYGSIFSPALKATLDPYLDANYNDKFSSAVGYLAVTGKMED